MSGRTEFWWVRHAPVTGHDGRRYGALDVDCDVSDDAAFQGLARLLPAEGALVSSGMLRARKTAARIAETGFRATSCGTEPELAEQDFGDLQGMTHADVRRAVRAAGAGHPHWVLAPDHAPPGGESFLTVLARVAKAAARLLRRHAGGRVVVVAHGGTIRAACALARGWDVERALALRIPNLSATRILGAEGARDPRWEVEWAGRGPGEEA